MTVVKVRIQKDFTIVYNGVLENPNLSFKAKGLWAYCMSRPDNWEFHVTHLATVSKDGTDAVYSALKELEAEGLVKKNQKNEKGRFAAVDYIIYPYPQEIQIILPLRAFPETENPALISTDSLPRIKEESSSSSLPPSDPKKEMMRMMTTLFTFTEQEFEEAYRKYERLDPGKIPHPYAWFEAVIVNNRKSKSEKREIPKANQEQIQSHRKQAEHFERKCPKSSNPLSYINCCSEYVEICFEGKKKEVRYDSNYFEWFEETGWKD